MRLHLTSIVPFSVALALLALGFHYGSDLAVVGFFAFFGWGILSHTKNVLRVREEERARNSSTSTGLVAYKRNYKHETYFHGI